MADLGVVIKFPAIQRFVAEEIQKDGVDSTPLLAAMARSGLKEVPQPWVEALSKSVVRPEASVRLAVIAAAKSLPIAPGPGSAVLAEALTKIARQGDQPASLRLQALGAIPGGLVKLDAPLFEFLLDRLKPEVVTSERVAAADILAKGTVDDGSRLKLAEAMGKAGPLELPRLLDAMDTGDGAPLGRAIVAALLVSPARSSLRIETLKPRLDRFGDAINQPAERLYQAIQADSSDRSKRLEDLLGEMKSGDIRRGQAIFNGAKASCNTCHAIGYVGGRLGPDLSKIGQIRSDRDLLEAIVFPSASFVRSYEPVAVATTDGKVISGLLRSETSDEVVVALAADRDERIPRSKIDEIQPGTVSVMPAGLDRVLTNAELADLIAFLRACR